MSGRWAPRRHDALALVVALVAGCAGTPPAVKHAAASAAPAVAGATPSPAGASPGALGASPTGIVSPGLAASPGASPLVAATSPAPGASPSPLVALAPTANSSLVGKVRAPAGLISDQGGSIISDNGGGVVSNNGGSFHLLTIAQLPVARVLVALLDGSGQAVLDVDGKALTAVTGADGGYAFTATLPANNLIATAVLPGGHGTLQAIVPGDAKGQKVVDLDLVSTLTTGYILDQYIKGQADQQLTLDRLPGDVEAATRAKAQAALDAGAVAVPDALTTAKVDATVTSLRAKDTSFDQQMEAVRKLLLLAGQSDLGNGRDATTVALGQVTALAPAADGTLYFATTDKRVWHLLANGKLVTALGSGASGLQQPVEGVDGPTAMIDAVAGLALDAQGRLLVLEENRVLRLEATGKVHVALPAPSKGKFTFLATGPAAAGGGFDVLYDDDAQDPSTLSLQHVDAAGVAAKSLATDLTDQSTFRGLAHDGHGGFVAQLDRFLPGQPSGQDHRRELDALDGTSGASRQLSTQTAVFAYDGSQVEVVGGVLSLLHNDGSRVVLGPTPPNAWLVAIAADGAVYTAGGTQVYKMANSTVTTVAGLAPGTSGGGTATDLALNKPKGVAVGADGGIYVGDGDAHVVYHIDGAGKAAPFLGTGFSRGFLAPFKAGAATSTQIGQPLLVRVDAGGDVLVLDTDDIKPWVVKVNPAGQASQVFVPDGNLLVGDLAPAPDGSFYVVEGQVNQPGRIVRVQPDGSATDAAVPALPSNPLMFGLAPGVALAVRADGTLYVQTAGVIMHLAAGGGSWVTDVRDAPNLNSFGGSEVAFANLAVDAAGRIYYCKDNAIVRQEASGAKTVVAGTGGLSFAGSTVDDSIGQPSSPCFAPDGSLVFLDGTHRQVKRVPASKL